MTLIEFRVVVASPLQMNSRSPEHIAVDDAVATDAVGSALVGERRVLATILVGSILVTKSIESA